MVNNKIRNCQFVIFNWRCYNNAMNLLSFPSKHPVGIDISDLSLKLVQLQTKRHKITLQTLSRLSVPEGYITDGVIKNKAGVAGLLQQLTKETILGKVTSKEVIACLPETKTFIKLIALSRAEENVAAAIKSEIEKNIPYELAEVNYDWQIIAKDRREQKILVGVIPKIIADSYAEVLEEADLFPVALEIEAAAIVRSVLPLAPAARATALIVDIGAARSSLIAYADNTVLFTVSLPVSGKKYTAIIARELNLDLAKAEEAKIICGLDPSAAQGIIAATLAQMGNELITKITAALKYLTAHYPAYGKVGSMYLCGGGANLKGLSDLMTQRLNIPTQVSDVFTNIALSQKQAGKYFQKKLTTDKKITPRYQYQQDSSPIFATAIGLALRGVYLA